MVSVMYRRNLLWCGMRSCLWIRYKWCFQVPFGQLRLQGGDKATHHLFYTYVNNSSTICIAASKKRLLEFELNPT